MVYMYNMFSVSRWGRAEKHVAEGRICESSTLQFCSERNFEKPGIWSKVLIDKGLEVSEGKQKNINCVIKRVLGK